SAGGRARALEGRSVAWQRARASQRRRATPRPRGPRALAGATLPDRARAPRRGAAARGGDQDARFDEPSIFASARSGRRGLRAHPRRAPFDGARRRHRPRRSRVGGQSALLPEDPRAFWFPAGLTRAARRSRIAHTTPTTAITPPATKATL